MPRENLIVPSERKPAVRDSRFKSSSRLEFELDKGDHFLRIEFVRIVLDTCVLVAAARSLEGASNRILRSLPIDGIEPCLSLALYAEWQEVLCRPEIYRAPRLLRMRRHSCASLLRFVSIRMCISYGVPF